MTPPAADTVLLTRSGAVATLTLNRPERRNAIDQSMRDSLDRLLAVLDEATDVRVVVLTGAGSAFCAGVDLGEGSAGGAPAAREPVGAPLWRFSKPVIAALNGPAVGGGLELALACDIRICAVGARVGLTEARIGSLPGSGGTQLLPRIVGSGNAALMLFSGELIDAQRALAMGLVSEVVADEALAETVADLAQRIAANAPLSLVAAKRALRAASELPLTDGLALERRLWADLAKTHDRAEGRAAFREKRPPNFEGR